MLSPRSTGQLGFLQVHVLWFPLTEWAHVCKREWFKTVYTCITCFIIVVNQIKLNYDLLKYKIVNDDCTTVYITCFVGAQIVHTCFIHKWAAY